MASLVTWVLALGSLTVALMLVGYVLVSLVLIIPTWRICTRAGFSGALSYYGIGLDDPDFTPPAQCRYDACVQISDDLMVSAPASVAMLPGGRYAVAQFNGPVREMPIAWTRLLREWMPASGLQMDSRPAFEHMVADSCFDAARGTITCDLCVSVRPL